MTSRPFALKRPEPSEAVVLRNVLHALQTHPRVAACWRANSGSGRLQRASGASQWINFGFKGQPDILGHMADGRALYVECKRQSGQLTPEQDAFLRTARNHGCVAFVARSIDDVWAELGGSQRMTAIEAVVAQA